MTAIPDDLKTKSANAFKAWDELRADHLADQSQVKAALEKFFAVSAEISALRKQPDEVLR